METKQYNLQNFSVDELNFILAGLGNLEVKLEISLKLQAIVNKIHAQVQAQNEAEKPENSKLEVKK